MDYWSGDGGQCFCQDDCTCMVDKGCGATLVISAFVAPSAADLPSECVQQSAGCSGNNDAATGRDGRRGDDDDDGVGGLSTASTVTIAVMLGIMLCLMAACLFGPKARGDVGGVFQGEAREAHPSELGGERVVYRKRYVQKPPDI